MTARFLQVHFLTSYSAVLLNRDDAGFAKRLPFGGGVRTRISSQCLKRHWRTADGDKALSRIASAEMSVRSRHTFQQRIVEPLVESGVDRGLAAEVATALMEVVLGKSDKADKVEAKPKARKAKAEADKEAASAAPAAVPSVMSEQLTVLGPAELRFLLAEATAIAAGAADGKNVKEVLGARRKGDGKRNMEALAKASAGLDAAMFGRMVTSDVLSRGDAAIHVAHAFTVHAEQSESDYFSAVDELQAEGDLGSAHINSSELTSGLFYGYVAIDAPLLLQNVGGDAGLAGEAVERLVHLIATVSPGAKLGSTAPHAYAQTVLTEVGDAQPRSLANAFLRPVPTAPDVLASAMDQLGEHLAGHDSMYGRTTRRQLASIAGRPGQELAERSGAELADLTGLARWSRSQVAPS